VRAIKMSVTLSAAGSHAEQAPPDG
jgi:hypothetical protein